MLGIFQNFGAPEIVILLFLALLIFGARRLPEIGKGLGKGIREFRDATKGLADDVKTGLEDDDARPSREARPSQDARPSQERRTDQ